MIRSGYIGGNGYKIRQVGISGSITIIMTIYIYYRYLQWLSFKLKKIYSHIGQNV